MKNTYKLENKEAISIILIIMINKLILNIPYYIVNLSGTGSLVNLIYIGIIDLILSLVIIKLLEKFQNSDILDVSYFLAGNKLKNIVGIISISLFFLVSFITLIDFCNVLHTIYFSNFDTIYIFLFFMIGILISNLVGIKSISRTISFLVPFAIISVIISFFAVWDDFSIQRFTPIFGKDFYTTFGLGFTNSFSMYIIVYYYFFKPLLANPKDFKKITIISYLISFTLLFITVSSMLTLFSTTTNNEPINSLFLLVRQIELGKFLQRVDSLFILLWILSIFAYLSFVIFIINRIIKKMTNISNEKIISFSTCSILLGLALIPINISKIHFIENVVYKYVILSFIFGIGLIILILGNIKKLRGNK